MWCGKRLRCPFSDSLQSTGSSHVGVWKVGRHGAYPCALCRTQDVSTDKCSFRLLYLLLPFVALLYPYKSKLAFQAAEMPKKVIPIANAMRWNSHHDQAVVVFKYKFVVQQLSATLKPDGEMDFMYSEED